jgi:hypothetical protein
VVRWEGHKLQTTTPVPGRDVWICVPEMDFVHGPLNSYPVIRLAGDPCTNPGTATRTRCLAGQGVTFIDLSILALYCTNVSALSSRCQMTSMCRARRLHLFAVFQRGLASTRIADIAVGDRLAISLDMFTQISWL